MSEVVFGPHLQPHEPALSASVRSPELGAGEVCSSRFGRVVDWVTFVGQIRFGANCDPGSGVYQLRLPVRALAIADDELSLGRGYCVGGAAGETCHLSFRLDGVSTLYAVADVFPAASASQRTVTESVPWPWAEGAHLHWSLNYEGVRQ